MKNLRSLEKQVIDMLLIGDHETLTVLRAQAELAIVSSHKETGVGFYTAFLVPPEAPRVAGQPTFTLGDVHGTAANLKHGLGFVLFITDGILEMLEGYTYDEAWPTEVQELGLAYSGGQNRNMDNLRKPIQEQ